MRDIRLYYYEHGGLRKINNLKYHKFDSFNGAVACIDKLVMSNRYKDKQFVITEYFGKYDSKIVGLMN